eukprot:TRINITY_DN5322_c0_g3_i1.p1 TRINITY_DN5322_c0_g3~~TRINITY_DN5322_c0_g3_i1.p1  ORF type:complete len:578 (-),score=140.61 TRINITY_DN5322_c0_g3_i1:89-1822(-)
MQKSCLFIVLLALIALLPFVSTRSLDGSDNNLAHPTRGTPGSLLQATYGLRQGQVSPLPSARTVTNTFFSERASKPSKLYTIAERIPGLSPNTKKLNVLVNGFNQLVGHDLSAVKLKSCFGPGCFVNSPITDPDDFLFMTTDEITGLSTNRTGLFIPGGNMTIINDIPYHSNDRSAYLDGNVFYGVTQTTLNTLRTFSGGEMKLRTDIGDTQFGELPDSKVTGTENQCSQFGPNGLASGDPRTETNSVLASLHTLFMREHNRLAAEFKTKNPTWTDEQLFQEARKWVIATFQHITVDEFIPTQFGGDAVAHYFGKYKKYDANVDVSLSNAFAVSANRVPHDQVNLPMLVLYPNGSMADLPGTEGWPEIERINCIADKFWEFGTDAIIRGSLKQYAQKFDGKHVDDIRSFPAKLSTSLPYNFDVKGMDVEREREAMVPSYYHVLLNATGVDLYNSPKCNPGPVQDTIECFRAITRNNTLANTLRDIYQKITFVEFHVGMVVADDKTSSGFPELAAKIWLTQLKKARDGDRFWYENYKENGLFTKQEFKTITKTTMADLVKRNTGINHADIPKNAFKIK